MAYIKKMVSKDLIWIKGEYFPLQNIHFNHYKYRVLLGIGGNIGDTIRRFDKLHHYLLKQNGIDIIENSYILKNPPFGYLNQDYFYNALIYISTNLTPIELLKKTQMVEKLFGRVKTFQDAPRTLDIDIIFHSIGRVNRDFLKIPHQNWKDRESVLLPLQRMKGDLWLKKHL